MGIYIKGMKMPKTCADCNFSTWNGFESVYCDVNVEFIPRKEWKEKRQDWCPLIEVPPHGRLIDADAVADEIWEIMWFPSNLANASFFVNTLRDAPTIIEAEDGT